MLKLQNTNRERLFMNIEIANRLVTLRKENGFSQEELAARLGISRQAVSKWERAESSPDTDNLIALAKLYRVSLDALLESSAENIANEQFAKAQEASAQASEFEELSIRSRAWYRFPYPLLVTFLYSILGIWRDWWHPGWILFLTIPLYYGIAQFWDWWHYR